MKGKIKTQENDLIEQSFSAPAMVSTPSRNPSAGKPCTRTRLFGIIYWFTEINFDSEHKNENPHIAV